ncbi:fibroblast growth factor-binding protein 2 [Alligator mississippiensis]|uniref:fibroblast growth factor-binding protein 2 n=1 Tax=Alligator mississippiensis TaxID=8496 RepID=UPI0006EC6471|nr:fibroblast growth factor-binding protein 2 [Alligator mississippiensis]
MKTVTFLLLMMISCLGGLGQKLTPKKRSNVEEIRFQTKAKDSCTMTVTGDEEVKLRIECRNQGKSYWCEYTGKPAVCRAFNNNPKAYWNQIALELRKLPNACLSTSVLKPAMCQKAPTDAHMKQVASSLMPTQNPSQQPDTNNQGKSVQKSSTSLKQAGKSSIKKAGKPRPSTLLLIKPTQHSQASENETEAMKLAREHCWESLHNFCSYIISFFRG